jgi:hypothetical protein
MLILSRYSSLLAAGTLCTVDLLVLTNLAHFHIKNIFYLCYKTSYLNEEGNCAEPSLSARLPWID